MKSNKLNNQLLQRSTTISCHESTVPAFSSRSIGNITHSDNKTKFPYLLTLDEIYALERGHLPGRDRDIPIRQRTLHPSILVCLDTVKNGNIKED